MLGRIPKTPYKWHFLVYCVTTIGVGANLTSLGPLVPYIAERYGGEIIQYSFLFSARALGYLMGSLLSKLWLKFLSYHAINFISSIIMGIMLLLMLFVPSLWLQTVFIFFVGMMNAHLDVFTNMCTIYE